MSYKSTHTGAQIDAGVSAALNPDTTVTPSSTNLVTSGAVDTAIKNATTNLAPAFDSTATYAIGDLVLYSGNIYRFTAAHTGAWDAGDVEQTTLGEEVMDLDAALALKADKTDVEYLKLREEEDRQMILGSVAEVVEDSYAELRSAPIHTAITIGQNVYPRLDNTRIGLETIKGRTVVDNDALVPCVVSGVEVTGFNAWDEEWELGGYSSTDGSKTAGTSTIRSKNKIRVFPSTQYYFQMPQGAWVYCYDADETLILNVEDPGTGVKNYLTVSEPIQKTLPANCEYITFQCFPEYGTTYNHDICINLSDPSRNGEYRPYQHSSLSIPSTTLNGVGSAQDYIEAVEVGENDYSLIKQSVMTEVDLGSLAYTRSNGGGAWDFFAYYAQVSGMATAQASAVCAKYLFTSGAIAARTLGNGCFDTGAANDYIYIRDDSFSDAAEFKTAMNGVKMMVELATPTKTTIAEHLTLAEVSMLAENGGIIGIVNANGDIVQPDLTVDTVISKSAS